MAATVPVFIVVRIALVCMVIPIVLVHVRHLLSISINSDAWLPADARLCRRVDLPFNVLCFHNIYAQQPHRMPEDRLVLGTRM